MYADRWLLELTYAPACRSRCHFERFDFRTAVFAAAQGNVELNWDIGSLGCSNRFMYILLCLLIIDLLLYIVVLLDCPSLLALDCRLG